MGKNELVIENLFGADHSLPDWRCPRTRRFQSQDRACHGNHDIGRGSS